MQKWRKATIKVQWKREGFVWTAAEEFSWREPEDRKQVGAAMDKAAIKARAAMTEAYAIVVQGTRYSWFVTVAARRYDSDPLEGQSW